MSSAGSLEEWLRKMGFDGEIPENLANICNPSTSFIWDQLISKVKPKQEVQYIKKNLIINRMKTSSNKQQNTFPIKEIEAYKRKQELRKQIEILENEIREKEDVLDNLLKSNKITYVSIQHFNEIVKENNQKAYLCEQKAVLLRREISEAQERLRTLRNFTPVEEEQSESRINETLKNCAEKLKLAVNKETRLKQQFTNSSCTAFTPKLNSTRSSLLKDISNQPSTERKPKRESLGLLAPSCIDELAENDEEFLKSTVSRRDFSPIPNSKFSSLSSSTPTRDALSLTSRLISNTIDETPARGKNDEVEGFSKDKEANELLRNCLYSTNRAQIMKICKVINEKLIGATKKTILDYHSIDRNQSLINPRQENLSGLYFVYIKNELETVKHRAVAVELQKTVAERKNIILEEFSKMSCSNNMRDEYALLLELRMEDAQLDAALKFLKRANMELKSESYFVNDGVLSQIKKTNEDIMTKVDQIENSVSNISKVFDSIKNTSEQALSSVRGLSQFIYDVYWAKPLQEQLFSNEIKIFERFPLHFNKKQQLNEAKPPTTNVLVPSYVNLDSNELSMLTTIVDVPFSPSESIILNIIYLKNKLTKWEMLQPPVQDLDASGAASISLDGEQHEGFIERYRQFLGSENVKTIIASPNLIKLNMEQWLEAPVRSFIPKSVLIEGNNYNYYENIIKRLTFEF